MPKNLKYYFKKAEKEKWAIGQFNFSNAIILKAIVQAAVKLKAPVILGTSEGESKSLGLKQAAALVKSYQKEIPLFLNLDHGKSFEYIKKAADSGYSAVHFDGSNLFLAKNIETTKKIVKYGNKKNIVVEGEVGFIKGASRILKIAPKIEKKDLTNPEEAETFIRETGVDSLAVSVGTFHGMKDRGKNPSIDLKRLKDIKKRVGNTPLVLHGGSGVKDKDIRAAILSGVVKVNINTELRVAYTKALKTALSGKSTVPYKYTKEVVLAVQKVVENKIKLFRSNNKI